MGRALRTSVIVFALFAIPRCSCRNDSPPDCAAETAQHATFVTVDGFCGGESCELQCDSGFLDCDNDSENGCETSTDALSALNERLSGGSAENDQGCGTSGQVVGKLGTCDVTCEVGFFDCNHDKNDGCESNVACGSKFPDAKAVVDSGADASAPTSIASLSGTPRGLTACAGAYYALDDEKVIGIDATTLAVSVQAASPGPPAGGLACDGAALYWTTSPEIDASTLNGNAVRMDLVTHAIEVIATGLDPGPGVAVRDATVYFFARSGLGGPMVATAAPDGGLSPWMPTMNVGVYESFALGPAADWSTWNDLILRRDDAGATPWMHAHAMAVMTDDAGNAFAIVPQAPPSSDGGDDASSEAGPPIATYAELATDDAGQPALATSDAGFEPIVTTSSENGLYAASTDAIYALLPPGAARVAQSSRIAYVTADAEWIVWATTPANKSPGAVWRVHK